MGRVTPIQDSDVESAIIETLQKGLRNSYPSNWAVMDSRVGSFLDQYIRVSNSVKRSITDTYGYNSVLANMVANGAGKTLSQNFLNEVMRQTAAGNVPFWMTNPISAARGAAAQNAAIRQEDAERAAIEKARKEAEGPNWLEQIFGKTGLGGVGASWATAARWLPWLAIAGGAAFLWFSFGQPARTATRNVARRL